ncbi:MAG: Stk1 family PASTA domain-containing Ser/Thr kinase [Clostridia bacterium]|nr:Stk1 family PASTA domain-containing Ser/Thr kinase [Clostridia bacterium]
MDKYVGKRLDGRYEIQEIIGVGGMAVVYKARDNQENRTVAIKILKDEFVSNEEFLRRFKNESKAIAMLSHQNIVNVYDVSFGDLIQYIVMEYIEGITLKEFIEREGSLRWKDAVHFTLQILKALQHAHDKGIVHRDVKPQNIMVLPDGTIKVTDFGIARFARSDQRTITDKAIGSVHYISPEQARGEKTDEKADIYSVGVMLYEMLTGRLPFQAESAVSVAIMQLQRDPQLPTEINSSIPLGLEQITMHAMQKTPERRYQSAAEMLCDLDKFRKDPALTFEYNYFVDSSPTKFVDTATVAAGAGIIAEQVSNIEDDSDAKNEKNSIIPILAGIAVALIIALIVLAIIFLPKLFGGTGKEIKCPDFIGKTWTEVEKNEEYNDNFDFEIEWGNNADYAYGYIYGQSEKEGAKLKKDHTITLQVSMGQKTVKVPDVSNKTESAAVGELKSKGLNPVIQTEPSEDYDKGIVIRTDPARTTTVPEGANVTVYVSSGKTVKKVKVPDVIGMERKAAEDELKKEGLVPQVEEVQISINDRFYPVGLVVKQDPKKSSTEVNEGTTVKISVCTGYKFDVKLDEIPTDFATESYYLTLWEDGKMIDSGDKISSTDTTSYTFDNVKTTKKKLDLIVKISADGTSEEPLYDISVDIEAGRVRIEHYYPYSAAPIE